ncbi:MAG TPA: hypothetical protein DHW78_11095 [Ruminococcaceae bacterium]|jgi:hypothetical protein|nr:hypothetical protein [Oscillospiraceae bacterium]HCM24848.1 hypothetical protein [Oscillospiraceae bacterium]
MKIYKYMISITGILAAINFFLTVILEWRIHGVVYSACWGHESFYRGLFSGVFVSCTLALMTSILNYYVEKGKVNASIKYHANQVYHIANIGKLRLEELTYNADMTMEDAKKLWEECYDIDLQLKNIFIDASLNESKSINNHILKRIDLIMLKFENIGAAAYDYEHGRCSWPELSNCAQTEIMELSDILGREESFVKRIMR